MGGIIVVGDIHGDWAALNNLMNKKKPSIVLQCGDFGWWPRMSVKKSGVHYGLKAWSHKGLKIPEGTKVYWCDGNHEDHDSLAKLRNPAAQRQSVEVYKDCHYMPRGSVLTLPDGRKVMFFGGAESIDKYRRTPGIDWFPEEIPNYAEVDRALSLETKVDIIISHTAPTDWTPDASRPEKVPDPTCKMLQAILEVHRPKHWFHGHWHHAANGSIGATTVTKRTHMHSLDYPRHGGRWWLPLED